MSDKQPHYEIEDYADNEIQEFVGVPIPTFLKWVYLILPIWGVLWFYFFWNGSAGALDRGSWRLLQESAKTTVASPASSPSGSVSR